MCADGYGSDNPSELRAQLQKTLSLGGLAERMVSLPTIMDTDADEDVVSEIKPVMIAEVTAAIEMLQEQEEHSMRVMQMASTEEPVARARAAVWIAETKIKEYTAQCTDVTQDVNVEEMEQLEKEKRGAKRKVELKERHKQAIQASSLTSTKRSHAVMTAPSTPKTGNVLERILSTPVRTPTSSQSVLDNYNMDEMTLVRSPAPNVSVHSFPNESTGSPNRVMHSQLPAVAANHFTLAEIMRDKPMITNTKAVVLAGRDCVTQKGVPRWNILLGCEHSIMIMVCWREQTEIAQALTINALDKVISLKKH